MKYCEVLEEQGRVPERDDGAPGAAVAVFGGAMIRLGHGATVSAPLPPEIAIAASPVWQPPHGHPKPKTNDCRKEPKPNCTRPR